MTNQYRIYFDSVAGSILNRTYGYDANGNITSFGDGEAAGNEALENAGIYRYDQGTNLLADIQGGSPVVYDYDENGNTISANNRTFTYDLIQSTDYGPGGCNNPWSVCLQRAEPTDQEDGPGAKRRIFHYDLQGHLIAETDPSGQTLVEYFYLGDQPLAMIRPTEALYYYHNDHLGTPQILTNDSGTVSWKAVYTPFGEAEISVQTVENPFRFPGQYYDQETGLHYNWNRYYDPKTGRYLTPDPIGLEGGTNLFVYVGSNPVGFIDPHGLAAPLISPPLHPPIHTNKPHPFSPSPWRGTAIPEGEAGIALGCITSCLGQTIMITGGSECTPQGSHQPGSLPGSYHCTNQAFDLSVSTVSALGKKRLLCWARECGIQYVAYEGSPPHYHFQTVPGIGGTSGILPKGEECCPPYRLE